MRLSVLCLLASILTSTTLSASGKLPTDPYVPNVVQSRVVALSPDTETLLYLDKVTVGEPAAADEAVAAQLGPSGSFWWLVGVIVVSGLILAVIL